LPQTSRRTRAFAAGVTAVRPPRGSKSASDQSSTAGDGPESGVATGTWPVAAGKCNAIAIQFADAVIAHGKSIARGDRELATANAREFLACAGELLLRKPEGPAALARQLDHADPAVRVTAASLLIEVYRDRAISALRSVADGDSIAALEARVQLARLRT